MDNKEVVIAEENLTFCLSPVQEKSMMEDMEYLKSMCIHHVAGQQYMGDSKLPFNVSYIMPESEFTSKWLIQFTLGGYYGVNYFNYPEWFKLTNNGKLCVLVVDEENKPMFIVDPISGNNLNAEDRNLLATASRLLGNNYYEENRLERSKKDNLVATKVDEYLSHSKKTLTDFIPTWYYEHVNVIPEIKQKMFYIRDVLNKTNPLTVEELLKGEEILIKELKGQSISQEEIDFIKDISDNKYRLTFKEKVEDETNEQEPKGDAPFNPLEC